MSGNGGEREDRDGPLGSERGDRDRGDGDGPLGFHLDDQERGRCSAADRVAEADAHEPLAPAAPARPARGRFTWVVGVLAVLALAYVTLNSLRTEGTGSRGLSAGDRLPPFAVPLAVGTLEGDANVATAPGESQRGRRPACAVRGTQIVNLCQLAERGPLVLAFLGARGERCERQLDLLERVRRRPASRGVEFAAVAIRGDRGRLRSDIRKRGWRFPVGYDRDGLVANIYGVAVCPTITLAYPGGIAMRTTLGLVSESALRRSVAQLAAASRERGWAPPR